MMTEEVTQEAPKKFVDNYAETKKRLAQHVLASSLAKDIPARQLPDIQAVADGDEKVYFYGIDFRRDFNGKEEACECTLYLDLKTNYDRDRLKDDEGNMFVAFDIRSKVSWPSWGGTEPELAMARVELMEQVCRLAREIKERFAGPIFQLTATKAQQDAWKAEQAAKELQSKVKKLVEQNMRRMLVGQTRHVSPEEMTEKMPTFKGEIHIGRPNGDLWKFDVESPSSTGNFKFHRFA